ncbi:KH homology domain-containing protein 1 [Ailuropoda melanoleuca]|nr:KH homology domain-containing protein 1 [Ailuropoda melanoleuca]
MPVQRVEETAGGRVRCQDFSSELALSCRLALRYLGLSAAVAQRPHPFTGPDGELLTAFRRWLEVLLLVNALPGCTVLMLIIGWPFYQYLAMLLIRTMAFQLRIRENRARARTRRLLSSAWTWGVLSLRLGPVQDPLTRRRVCLIVAKMNDMEDCKETFHIHAWVAAVQDMERRACREKPWWAVSENFDLPLVFYMKEDPEEPIFGHLDTDLHSIEAQATSWFTAAGHIRVAVVGPPEARPWLFDMIWSLERRRSDQQAQGLKILQLVPSHPPTKDDLAVSPSTQLFASASLLTRVGRTVSAAFPGFPYQMVAYPRFPLISLY